MFTVPVMCAVIGLAQNCSHPSLRDCFNWYLGIPEWLLWKALVTQASGKISKILNLFFSLWESPLCVSHRPHLPCVSVFPFISSLLCLSQNCSSRVHGMISWLCWPWPHPCFGTETPIFTKSGAEKTPSWGMLSSTQLYVIWGTEEK